MKVVFVCRDIWNIFDIEYNYHIVRKPFNMSILIDQPVLETYNTAFNVSEDFKNTIEAGSDEHLDFISSLKPMHDSFITALDTFNHVFAENFPNNDEHKATYLIKIKELMNLVEFTRKVYTENELTRKTFPTFIDNLFIQANELFEFIHDLSIENSIWDDEELIF